MHIKVIVFCALPSRVGVCRSDLFVHLPRSSGDAVSETSVAEPSGCELSAMRGHPEGSDHCPKATLDVLVVGYLMVLVQQQE